MDHAHAHTYGVDERETIVKTDNVRVHTLKLAADQSVPWHKHSEVDDTFLCMSGPMVIRTDASDQDIVLHPGDRHTVAAGVGHYVEPMTEAGTKFLLIQAVGKHDFIPIEEPA